MIPLFFGVLIFLGSGALVLLADQKGWLPKLKKILSSSEKGLCPHKIAKANCPFCDESLIEKKGMCFEHGVPEALCSQCSPFLVLAFKSSGDWCGGHNVPESQCEKCNPGILDKYKPKNLKGAVSEEFLSLTKLVKPSEDVPRTLRPPAAGCTKHKNLIQFLSADIAKDSGIKAVPIKAQPITETLSCNVEITYNKNVYAHLASRLQGIVHEIQKGIGDKVKKGEVLAVINSVELGMIKAEYLKAKALVLADFRATKAEYMQAKALVIKELQEVKAEYLQATSSLKLWEKNFNREKKLLEKGASTEKEILEAEVKLSESQVNLSVAVQKLKILGLDDKQIAKISQRKDSLSLSNFGYFITEINHHLQNVHEKHSASQITLFVAIQKLKNLGLNHVQIEKISQGQHFQFEFNEPLTKGIFVQDSSIVATSLVNLSYTIQKLKNLGLSETQIEEISQKKETSPFFELIAPFDGLVVERDVALGETVSPSKKLFTIADTSTMWAMIDIYEDNLSRIKVNQEVQIRLDGLKGETFLGKITWLSTYIDPETRTLKARSELKNVDGLLRANMFGTGEIILHEKELMLIVSKESVQWEGCCNIVFVQLSDTLFEPRKVKLGYKTDEYYAVEKGLAEKDLVVTTGSFLLKTEILKGSIGAGCCGE